MDEKILLRVWPEYGSTGIWMPTEAGGQLAGPNVSYESLNLPDDLKNDFIEWQDIFTNQRLPEDDTIDWDAFGAKGLELAKCLKIHLFYKAHIEYEWEGIQKIYGYMVMGEMSASVWDDEDTSCALEDIEDEMKGFKIEDCDSLQKRFDLWENEFEKCYSDDIDWDSFNKEGRALVEELQKRLPEYCTVFYNHAYEESHPQWWK